MTLPKPNMNRRSWILGSITAGLVIASNRSYATTIRSGSMFRVRTIVKLNGEIRLKSQINDARTSKGTAIAAKTAPIQASTVVDFEEHMQIGAKLTDQGKPEGGAALRSLKKRLKREQRKRRALVQRKKRAAGSKGAAATSASA